MAIGSKSITFQMQQIIESENIKIFTSLEQLEELTSTLQKPKLHKYLTKIRTQNLFEIILLKTELIKIKSNIKICRDPKDDFIINLAIDAKVNLILSGDSDLLVLNPFKKIEIKTITEFLK